MQKQSRQIKEHPLRPVLSKHFVMTKVNSDCTLEEFCKVHYVRSNKINMLLEHGSFEDGDIRDVILVDKVGHILVN